MRSLIDTTLFVYATYPACAEHPAARAFLRQCATGGEAYAVSWGIVYEYLRVVTHPRLFPGSTVAFDKAAENVGRFCQLPNVEILQETPRHWDFLHTVVRDTGRLRGNILHDCHIATLMREHDIRRIYTADSHFRLFKGITVVNPLRP